MILSIMVIVTKSLKVKPFTITIMDMTLTVVIFIVFKIPLWPSALIDHSYDRFAFILLITTILHGALFYNRSENWQKYNKVLRMFIPLIPLFIKELSFELGIIFSVILYNFVGEIAKIKMESLVSYLIAGIAIIKFYLESYYDSRLSIVNFQIIDTFQYLSIGMSILCMCAFVLMMCRWHRDKETQMINIYWPFMFVVLSLRVAMIWPSIYNQYLLFLACGLGVVTVFLWREKYILAVIFGVLSLLFISPFFYLIPLVLLVAIRYQGKYEVITHMLRLEFLDITTLVIIVTAFRFNISPVGIFSIILFLFMIRNLNKEIVVE